MELHIVLEQSKEEGKGQESIRSSTTHDPVWEGNINTRKHHIQGSREVSPCPTGEHKIARKRHDRQDTFNPA